MTTLPTAPPSDYKPSLLSRTIAAFSGGTGRLAKLFALGLLNAFSFWAIVELFTQDRILWVLITLAALLLVDAIYFLPGLVPAKFIVPGTIFLIAYLIIPIFFTVTTAFQIYSTGHVLTKNEAISAIQIQSLQPTGVTYVMSPARTANGELVLLLYDEDTGRGAVGTPTGVTLLPPGTVKLDANGVVQTTRPDYTVVPPSELFSLDTQLTNYTVPTKDGAAIRPEGVQTAVELKPTLAYDKATDTFTNIESKVTFTDNGKGSYAAADGTELEPGWREYIGWANITSVFKDPLVRNPFLRTLVWTIVFATCSVFFSFAIGLFLAIALDKPTMRFRKVYRSLLVIPYAIPGFLMLLVWAGLLNDDFGVINKILPGGLDRPWLFDPFWARVSVIMVTTWLTVPYFMLVSMGALQSIPGELT